MAKVPHLGEPHEETLMEVLDLRGRGPPGCRGCTQKGGEAAASNNCTPASESGAMPGLWTSCASAKVLVTGNLETDHSVSLILIVHNIAVSYYTKLILPTAGPQRAILSWRFVPKRAQLGDCVTAA